MCNMPQEMEYNELKDDYIRVTETETEGWIYMNIISVSFVTPLHVLFCHCGVHFYREPFEEADSHDVDSPHSLLKCET